VKVFKIHHIYYKNCFSCTRILSKCLESSKICISDFINGAQTLFQEQLIKRSVYVDSSTILSLINFQVPQRSSRSTFTFLVLFIATNFISNRPIRGLTSHVRYVNTYYTDPFNFKLPSRFIT